MAVPKKRKSHSRTRMQRSHQALTVRQWVKCPQCQKPTILHHVCPSCGRYRNHQVINLDN